MIRSPAVAGRFYPAGPHALTAMVDALLSPILTDDSPIVTDDSPIVADDSRIVTDDSRIVADDDLAEAYVVPHAGYRYSGPTAAQVYARLRRHADRISRVVLIGPAHYVPLTGCAAPSVAAWATPLGEVPVDQAAVRALADAGQVAVDDDPHAPEHSLEVQLPFLQRVLPSGVPILPLVVGGSRVDEVADTLAAATEPGTVVLCSTDLSHYLDQAAARRRDERTTQAVLDLDADRIGIGDACGMYALRGLVGWAHRERLRPRLLQLCSSADTAGDPGRVVGYAALSFSR
jgi:AmmeMemoRadiSam system protein B